jgi:hypothetical protein
MVRLPKGINLAIGTSNATIRPQYTAVWGLSIGQTIAIEVRTNDLRIGSDLMLTKAGSRQ